MASARETNSSIAHDPLKKVPNDQTQQPAHAGAALKQGEPSVAWPVCCSASFGLRLTPQNDLLDRDAELVAIERDTWSPLHGENQIIGNVFSDDNTAAGAVAKVLVHPAHVVQNLPQCLVPTPRQFQLEDYESTILVHSQDVDPAIVHGELDALLSTLLVKS